MLKLISMAKITNSGFSYDKQSVVSVSDETRNFNTNCFCYFNSGKMLIKFHSVEKWLFSYFHTLTFTLWISMKEYDKHFLSTRVTHAWAGHSTLGHLGEAIVRLILYFFKGGIFVARYPRVDKVKEIGFRKKLAFGKNPFKLCNQVYFL